jgi:hypothetical protein
VSVAPEYHDQPTGVARLAEHALSQLCLLACLARYQASGHCGLHEHLYNT